MSYANGEIYIKNIRSAANTDTYTFSGDENGETFVPSFTHMVFAMWKSQEMAVSFPISAV